MSTENLHPIPTLSIYHLNNNNHSTEGIGDSIRIVEWSTNNVHDEECRLRIQKKTKKTVYSLLCGILE